VGLYVPSEAQIPDIHVDYSAHYLAKLLICRCRLYVGSFSFGLVRIAQERGPLEIAPVHTDDERGSAFER